MNNFSTDLTERVLTTFLSTFIPALLAAGPVNLVDLSVWQSAAIAGGAATVSLLKGIMASGFGNRSSASLTKNV